MAESHGNRAKRLMGAIWRQADEKTIQSLAEILNYNQDCLRQDIESLYYAISIIENFEQKKFEEQIGSDNNE